MPPSAAPDTIRAEIEEHQWYHTLELAPGLVTPGWFDLRDIAPQILPDSLAGKRCLDIGTFDGFWAFEMERRGASEVLGIDILDPYQWDWPAGSDEATIASLAERKRGGAGFERARAALGFSATRRDLSIYDLDPDDVGTFDFIYLGSLLLHLRDPIGALLRTRTVSGDAIVICDAIDLPQTVLRRRSPRAKLDARGRPWWWKPNLAALARMVEAAGFELTARPRHVRMRPGRGYPRMPLRPRTVLNRSAREQLVYSRLGDPHGVVTARAV